MTPISDTKPELEHPKNRPLGVAKSFQEAFKAEGPTMPVPNTTLPAVLPEASVEQTAQALPPLEIEIRINYGRPMGYPVSALARAVLAISKRDTFTRAMLEDLEAAGLPITASAFGVQGVDYRKVMTVTKRPTVMPPVGPMTEAAE